MGPAMSVRRLLAGVLVTVVAVPLLAAAPRTKETRPPRAIPAPPAGWATRVFARAEAPAEPVPSASDEPVVAPPVASTPSPEIAARARAELEANRNGKIDRSRYSPDLNARITDGALAEASAALRSLGAVKAFTQVRKITQGGLTVYVFRIAFEKPPLIEETIAWDPSGKVDLLQFGPVR
jgi:hypothetical protein